MTRAECRYCELGYYKDGKCYADRSRTGRPVKDYIACDWARKKVKTTPKK